MTGRQQHPVIQLVEDRPQRPPQGDEIDDVAVLVQRPVYLGGHAVVVAVEPLADVALKRDEVPGAEDQVVAGDADPVVFGHGVSG